MGYLVETSGLGAKEIAMMSPDVRNWIYNGFDCMLTREILDKTLPLLEPNTKLIYDFDRALQGPALDMMLFGIKVDGFKRDELFRQLQADRYRVERYFQALGAVFDMPNINANSPAQLKKLFYEQLKLPEQQVFDKGDWKVSVNKVSLDKLSNYLRAQPFIEAVRSLRDITQQMSVLKASIRNGRMYTSLNIGKETGRWSSSASAAADGRGLQNIMEKLRVIFIPDKKQRLGYADLRQAESLCVAYMAEDEAYIDAHLSGNVHALVCGMIFPEVKNIRKEIVYGHWTYYDLSKRASHATNYMAVPATLVKHLKIPIELAQEFQRRYFAAFPRIKEWHKQIATELQLNQFLVTPVGRKRGFFGRLSEDTTLREAVANNPQSLVADILNRGMYNVWQNVPDVQLLLPVHDAIFFQYPENKTNSVSAAVVKEMLIPVPINGRVMTIGVDVEVGYNWSKFNSDPKYGPLNFAGMVKWGSDDQKRQQRPDTKTALLARRVS